MLRIALLGPVAVELDRRPLTLPTSRNARALLALLAGENGSQARTLLADKLWPSGTRASSLTSLSTELYKLRKALGPNFDRHLISSKDRLGLQGESLWSDIRQFDESLTRGDLAGAKELWRGVFMQDTPGEWVERRRDDYLRRFVGVLQRLAQQHEEAGDTEAALAVTYEWRSWDGSDRAREQLVRRLARSGQDSAADDEHRRYLEDVVQRGDRPTRNQVKLLADAKRRSMTSTDPDAVDHAVEPEVGSVSRDADGADEHRRLFGGERLVEMALSEPSVTRTGFVALDRLVGSLPDGLVVVGARPRTGATAFLLAMAVHMAVVEGGAVGLFSPDLPERDVALRLIAGMSPIPMEKLRRRTMAESSWPKMLAAVERLSTAPLHVNDAFDLRADRLLKRIERLHADVHGLALVLVDDLRTVGDLGGESMLSTLVRLRSLGRRIAAPIVVVVPIDQRVEFRVDHSPRSADLPSWARDARADLVLLLYREELLDPETEREGLVDVIVAEHRRGVIGQVELVLSQAYGSMVNYTEIGAESAS